MFEFQFPMMDRRMGFFPDITRHRVDAEYDFLHVSTIPIVGIQGREIVAAGGGASNSRAELAAFGEAIERIALTHPQPGAVHWRRYEDCADTALDPRLLTFFDETVYQRMHNYISRFSASVKAPWIVGQSLVTTHARLVPADFIYNEYPRSFSRTERWDRPVSTGAACHTNLKQALLSGLYEVIERDVYMICWENRISGNVRALTGATKTLARTIEQKGMVVRIAELPSDHAASVAVAAVYNNANADAPVGIGSAARSNWGDASYRALEEAILTSMWMKVRKNVFARTKAQTYELLTGLPEPASHADFYAHGDESHRLAFLFDGSNGPTRSPTARKGDEINELENLIQDLADRGYESFWVDITPQEAASCGFHVVRVLVPGLVPLSRGLYLRHLLNDRMHQLPERLGIKPIFHSGDVSYPHPLP